MSDVDDELRQRVLADVLARTPVDERERISIDRFVDELDRLASPFDEHADPVHVTGSGFVTGHRGIVLLRHRYLGIWVQPGGHVDAGEAPWNAARREVTEEIGFDVRFPGGVPVLAHVDVHAGGRGHTHLDLRYLLEAPGDPDPAPPEGESQEVGWFAWDDALRLAEPALAPILTVLAAAD